MGQMKPTDIYEPIVDIKSKGIFGDRKGVLNIQEHFDEQPKLIQAWWEDNDVQYIKIVSTNVGFIREMTKRYKRKESKEND
jgi:hypothetical protein